VQLAPHSSIFNLKFAINIFQSTRPPDDHEMANNAIDNPEQPVEPGPATPQPYVAPSPHMFDTALTTRGMMRDVIIALSPTLVAAVVIFQWYAVVQVGLCVLSCLAAETVFTTMRGRTVPLADLSAAVTGVILGLSFPATAPWYVAVIGSFIAIGLGKVVFGGLGYNLFNPAMVGRAFVLLSFAKQIGASAYSAAEANVAVITQATPLTVAKKFASDLAAGKADVSQAPDVLQWDGLLPLLLGNVNGSLGETSSLALLIGGTYLCLRRSASWEIPVSCIAAAGVCAALANSLGLTQMTTPHQLLSGALLFGAFFIATDPVSSPLSPKGKYVFGAGIGVLVVLIRVFSGYPEGVMFAVLLMNATVPLINRWTIPRPLGGPLPQTS
jgi:electron transport complex protein RnfD